MYYYYSVMGSMHSTHWVTIVCIMYKHYVTIVCIMYKHYVCIIVNLGGVIGGVVGGSVGGIIVICGGIAVIVYKGEKNI